MKTSITKSLLFLMLAIPVMFGCKQLDSFSSNGSGMSDAASETSVDFNLDFSALLSSSSEESGSGSAPLNGPSASGKMLSFAPVQNCCTVTFESIPSGITKTFDLTASIDASWDVTVNHTMALQSGNYNVFMDVSNDGQRYFGTASGITINADATNDVAIEIHPVIGNSTVSAGVTTELPRYYFAYPAGDFDGTPDTYTMTVSVDGTDDTDFTFDEFTDTARLYMDIADGTHDLSIEVKKSGFVVARYNAVTNFSTGVDLTNLNLIPIFGTATFSVNEVGGDATVDINLLGSSYDLVNTETGGNFEYRISASGTYNDITEDVINFVVDGSGDYSATFTYSDFQFDTMAVDIRIYDTVYAEQVGNCAFNITLHKNGAAESCDLTLYRRAEASGRVMQVLGVNVVDASGDTAPVGTRVYVNGSLAGITGGVDVTDGYISLFLAPDATHDIFATTAAGDSTSDTTSYSAESWVIDNILIWLN